MLGFFPFVSPPVYKLTGVRSKDCGVGKATIAGLVTTVMLKEVSANSLFVMRNSNSNGLERPRIHTRAHNTAARRHSGAIAFSCRDSGSAGTGSNPVGRCRRIRYRSDCVRRSERADKGVTGAEGRAWLPVLSCARVREGQSCQNPVLLGHGCRHEKPKAFRPGWVPRLSAPSSRS